jgi:hypothetical protein
VRFIDSVFRQGHLSERALVDAIVSGDRPRQLDRCDICAERAVELARWMDDLRDDATGLADDVFTSERLAAQQQQIMRRLEQLDHPARVIAFPAASRGEAQGFGGRRVAMSWVAVAAAAGLVLGVVGGQVSARLTQPVAAPATASTAEPGSPASAQAPVGPINASVFAEPLDNLHIPSLDPVDEATPTLTQISARSGG